MQWWALIGIHSPTMSRLRVEAHLRGHVALCNGRVELVGARVEPYSLRDGESCAEAQELQARAEETRREKEERLLAFQRDVRERVQRRERARQQQLSEAASRHTVRERRRANRVSKKVRGARLSEREDVAVVVVEPGTAAQRARQSLLAASDPANIPNPAEHEVPEHFGSPLQVFPSRVTPTPSGPAPPSCGERSAGRRFTAASKLALGRRETQARQLQLFRRLYSDLEREATRQRRVRQSLQGSAERRRREQEVQRRAVEEGLAGEDSVLSRGSSLEVERERLEEWQETVALERRRHQLQTTRETERYVEALRAQLRERLASCPTPLPPLCSCGSTVWDTDPQTCANNCPFYRNPRAYAKALGNLLTSLKL